MDMILDATEGVVAARVGPSGLTKEDMQRIVQCVNFCKGLPEELLKDGSDVAKWAISYLASRGYTVRAPSTESVWLDVATMHAVPPPTNTTGIMSGPWFYNAATGQVTTKKP